MSSFRRASSNVDSGHPIRERLPADADLLELAERHQAVLAFGYCAQSSQRIICHPPVLHSL